MRPWELENQQWLQSFKVSMVMTICTRRPHGSRTRKTADFFGTTFCRDCHTTTELTRHHFWVASEKVWMWLCRDCHDKRHSIQPRKPKGKTLKQGYLGIDWKRWKKGASSNSRIFGLHPIGDGAIPSAPIRVHGVRATSSSPERKILGASPSVPIAVVAAIWLVHLLRKRRRM